MPVGFAPGLLLIACFLAASYGAFFCHRGPSGLKAALKGASVLLLAAAAFLFEAPALIVGALAISAVGDTFLARPGNRAFLSGMAFFALAHLLYIAFFTQSSGLGPLASFNARPAAAIALIVLALSSELWLAPRTGALVWPVRGYILIITAMGLAALTLPAHMGVALWGAVLFIASDLALALDLFVFGGTGLLARLRAMAVWSLYFFAQLMIMTGAVFAG